MRFIYFLSILVVACAPNVDNPSGDCSAEADGRRSGFHLPDRDNTYLPDCQNPLDRELWRVFAQSESSAYIMPRPDATGLSYGVCNGEDEEMAILFASYGLCEEYGDPDVINNIAPTDALSITNTLHQLLRFEIDDAGMISPWAPDDDIIAACELTDSADAQEYCELLESRCDRWGTCTDIGYIPSNEAVEALVPAINQLYGIETE